MDLLAQEKALRKSEITVAARSRSLACLAAFFTMMVLESFTKTQPKTMALEFVHKIGTVHPKSR